MHELLEALVEPLALLVYLVGSALFTVAGLLAEQVGIADVLAGQTTVGLWYVYMGLVALFVGVYAMGYREVWPRLRAAAG